jgi:hypothetical protein
LALAIGVQTAALQQKAARFAAGLQTAKLDDALSSEAVRVVCERWL